MEAQGKPQLVILAAHEGNEAWQLSLDLRKAIQAKFRTQQKAIARLQRCAPSGPLDCAHPSGLACTGSALGDRGTCVLLLRLAQLAWNPEPCTVNPKPYSPP